MSLKYSIILATVHSLKWITKISSKEAELIVVDSNYNEKTKKYLELFKDDYYDIIYTKPEKYYGFPRDFAQAKNTCIMYSEGKYLINVDNNVEFSSNFWKECGKSIEKFPDSVIIGQKSQDKDGEIAWVNYLFERYNIHKWDEIKDVRLVSAAFGIIPMKLMLDINGWDILYDCSWGPEDRDLLLRLLIQGKAVVNTDLMGFVHNHKSWDRTPTHPAYWIFDIMFHQIINGKVWAFNPFNLREVRNLKLKEEKEKWKIR